MTHTPGPFTACFGYYCGNAFQFDITEPCAGSVRPLATFSGNLVATPGKYTLPPEQIEANGKLFAAAHDYFEAAALMIASEDNGGDLWWRGFEMLKAAHKKAGGTFPSMDQG